MAWPSVHTGCSWRRAAGVDSGTTGRTPTQREELGKQNKTVNGVAIPLVQNTCLILNEEHFISLKKSIKKNWMLFNNYYIVRVFTNPSLRALGHEKRFRDNHVLKTALSETVISRSILCNLGRKLDNIKVQILFFLMVLMLISFGILLYSLWKR